MFVSSCTVSFGKFPPQSLIVRFLISIPEPFNIKIPPTLLAQLTTDGDSITVSCDPSSMLPIPCKVRLLVSLIITNSFSSSTCVPSRK